MNVAGAVTELSTPGLNASENPPAASMVAAEEDSTSRSSVTDTQPQATADAPPKAVMDEGVSNVAGTHTCPAAPEACATAGSNDTTTTSDDSSKAADTGAGGRRAAGVTDGDGEGVREREGGDDVDGVPVRDSELLGVIEAAALTDVV
jgi:hypothetical protein